MKLSSGGVISHSHRFIIVAIFAFLSFAAAGYGAFYLGRVQADSDTPLAGSIKRAGDRSVKANQPVYGDYRYLILMIDAIVIAGLTLTLVLRLLNRAISRQGGGRGAEKELPDAKDSGGGRKTVDQLNIDIPL